MSKEDDWGNSIIEEGKERGRDKYIQWVVAKLEDPDYDGIPILIDKDSVLYPDGVDEVTIVKALQAAAEFMKTRIFK